MVKKKVKKAGAIAAPIVAVCVVFVIVLVNVIIPNNKYNDAVALRDAGKYNEAITAFQGLEGYKDSEEQKEACDSALENEKIKKAKVGDTVVFGHYEQDNYNNNGKEEIEWIVLANRGKKALLLSKHGLAQKRYNKKFRYITWQKCTLRKWMNNQFLNSAFTKAEKKNVLTTKVTSQKNPKYNYIAGPSTKDKVFLLNIQEMKKYLTTDEARECALTASARAQGYYKGASSDKYYWWLRSPGDEPCFAAGVDPDGSVYYHGYRVHYDHVAVRPALWINLDS